MSTEYAQAKNAYEKLVKVKTSNHTSLELHEARTEFIAASEELFPRLGRTKSQLAVLDLIDYNRKRFSRRKKVK